MLSDVTLLIKTFERPECLRRLVSSIRRYYPQLPIHVADDSRQPLTDLEGVNKYIPLPYDVGISAGRNTLVESADTLYVVILDDDFLFTSQTDLELMHKVLETTSFNLVGGLVGNGAGGIFEYGERQIVIRVDSNHGFRDGYPVLDCVLNFFMAQADLLREVGWDPQLKVFEHADFFLRGREPFVVTQVDSHVGHSRSTGNRITDNHYSRMRKRGRLKKAMLRKWGVDQIVWKKTPAA